MPSHIHWRTRAHTHTYTFSQNFQAIRWWNQRVLSLSFTIMRISLSRKYPEAICCIVFCRRLQRLRTHSLTHTQAAMHFRIFIFFYSFPFRRLGFVAYSSTMLFILFSFRQLRAQSFGFFARWIFHGTHFETVCRAMPLFSTASTSHFIQHMLHSNGFDFFSSSVWRELVCHYRFAKRNNKYVHMQFNRKQIHGWKQIYRRWTNKTKIPVNLNIERFFFKSLFWFGVALSTIASRQREILHSILCLC